MSRPLLLLVAVVLAGIAAWVVLAPPPADEGAVPEETTAEAPAAPEAGALAESGEAAGAAERVDAPSITRTQVEEAAAGGDEDGPAVLPSLEDGAGIRVEVVDPEDAPLAGALVLVVDSGRMDEFALEQAMASTRDVGEVLEKLGERYRTRADGSVVIPHAEQMLAVAARSGRLSTFRLPAAPDAEGVLRLQLQPGRALQVKVVDAAGQPVPQAPVAVTMKQGSRSQGLLGGETGADGLAVIDDLELLDTVPFRGDTAVALAMMLDVPVAEDVDLREPPEEAVELVKPPTGSLVVELLDRDGAPAGADVQVVAQVVPEGEDPEFERWSREGHAMVTGSDGKAEYPYVGLGLRITVEARDVTDSQVWRGSLRGPAADGAQAVLRLEPDTSLPVVVVQLVDEQGQPLAGATLQASFTQKSERSRSSSSSRVRSDGEGRLRYAFDEPPQKDAERALDLVLVGEQDHMARLDLSGTLAPGENDYGRLVVTQAPLIAAGTVLGPDGQPVAGAEVRVARREYWGPVEEDNYYWDTLWQIDSRSDGEGRFELRGLVDAQELQVTASHEGMQPAVLECGYGAAGLVLRLQKGASVGGRVLLDEKIDHEAVNVSMAAVDGEHQGSSWQDGLDADGAFSWDALPSGRYDLVVQSSQGGEELYRVDGVDVAAGSGNNDPRIAEIDLRGKLTCFTLEFQDPQGRSAEQVQLYARAQELYWWAWGGEVTIVTKHPVLTIEVHADGFRAETLTDVRDDRVVKLRAGLPLRLTLDQPGAVPTGWEVSAWINLKSEDARNIYGHGGSNSTFDARGEALLRAPGPGTYDVSLMLGRAGGSSSWGFGDNQQVEVVEAAGEQRAMITLDPEALETTRQMMIENEGGR